MRQPSPSILGHCFFSIPRSFGSSKYSTSIRHHLLIRSLCSFVIFRATNHTMAPSSSSAQPLSLLDRKTDILWIALLIFEIFLAVTLDFVPYYPLGSWLRTNPFHEYYVTAYNDPLYTENPTFWQVYVAIELVFSMPMATSGIQGLIKGDDSRTIHLLALATHVISSCLVCIAEIWSANGWSVRRMHPCLPGQIAHLFVWVVFWLDLFGRLKRKFAAKAKRS